MTPNTGIWSEFGQNMVGMRSEYGQNMVGNDLKIHLFSTQIPLGMTQKNLEWLKSEFEFFLFFHLEWGRNLVRSAQIPTILLGSAWNVWGRVKYWAKPIPTVRVRVSWGWGTGSPGKPQGYLCHSLQPGNTPGLPMPITTHYDGDWPPFDDLDSDPPDSVHLPPPFNAWPHSSYDELPPWQH